MHAVSSIEVLDTAIGDVLHALETIVSPQPNNLGHVGFKTGLIDDS